ncbi:MULTISPECIES: hypothetical protein [unclassified Saccharicrinis]|uniref:hypothetical protein n=1 Tax=unclassified Saccharicrinis TaxID=2646859 RepID=UPI003D342920
MTKLNLSNRLCSSSLLYLFNGYSPLKTAQHQPLNAKQYRLDVKQYMPNLKQ